MEFMLAILFLIAGFGAGRYRRGLAENMGEAIVRRKLVSAFHGEQGYVLNNLTLPIKSGSTQIDHVLVTTHGVFVIETKHYSGWIFGDENSAIWMQVIYKTKNKFQNPLRQNYLHLKTIENLLDFLPKEAIHSAVVFTGSAEFKTDIPNGVFTIDQLVRHIQSMPDEIISLNRLAFCVGRIECARFQLSEKTDIEHQSSLIKKFGRAT